MNLLVNDWIPVTHQGRFRHISLKDLLCKNEDWQISLNRDDMELAALQLVICLVQVVFMPDDGKELRRRMETPLTEDEFETGIAKFPDMFVLDHPEHPFMQTRGVEAKEITSMQKLFIGLPEGNNHAFFNETGEVVWTCPSCTVIAIFNQANNCPSFGGGFKGTLRGAAPITTFAYGKTLRETIWLNILDETWVEQILPEPEQRQEKPVWVDPIQKDKTVYSHEIGLLRGLLWQPAHIEIIWAVEEKACNACGEISLVLASGFNKEKFSYELKGIWPHPHGPRAWTIEKGERKERFTSFRSMSPAWTQLNEFLIFHESEDSGQVPAAVISRFKDTFMQDNLSLIVGGYRTKQASVLQRRHDLISMSAGWAGKLATVEKFIGLALEFKELVRKKMYGFGKTVGVTGLAAKAEELFYQRSESLIHDRLHKMNWRESAVEFVNMYVELKAVCGAVFEEIAAPYQNDPKMITALVRSRKTFTGAMNKLKPSI
ncbi:MAG: type I-E CRISPR-associated protein Cse1/CasA [Nitrospiraceae bacterium]|nr:MAG: type I-E CRISPR-associated protein Cse1/CasA [Nitrospiraceae bacterium]